MRWFKNLNSCNLMGLMPRPLFASSVSSHKMKTESHQIHCLIYKDLKVSWDSHLTNHSRMQIFQKSSRRNLTLWKTEFYRVWPAWIPIPVVQIHHQLHQVWWWHLRRLPVWKMSSWMKPDKVVRTSARTKGKRLYWNFWGVWCVRVGLMRRNLWSISLLANSQ